MITTASHYRARKVILYYDELVQVMY